MSYNLFTVLFMQIPLIIIIIRSHLTMLTDFRRQWERQVRSSSSLDELLRLTDFPDWKLWKCRLRLQPPQVNDEDFSFPPSIGSHRSTRYAAESYSLEILKAIDEEWQRTQCMPRETCVDVAKELGTDPSVFFKPPCVSVHRCGGCCNQEGITCRNTSTVYVNKTVLSVIPFKFVPEPVLIKVANHTACRCMEPAIIRRNAQQHRSSGNHPPLHVGRFASSCRPLISTTEISSDIIPYTLTIVQFLRCNSTTGRDLSTFVSRHPVSTLS
uniref:Vascular endothelial growth factor D n=1 Tax=Fundulus heteroclitus TaxID=8078 RepID=A0A3Q2QK34_FUNHE